MANTYTLENTKKKIRYYTPAEVALHNTENDLWISIWGRVFDLTPLVLRNKGKQSLKALLAFGGKDLSHLFDKCTGDILYYNEPGTELRVPRMPHGPLPDAQPAIPDARWQPLRRIPWWRSEAFIIGRLSARTRPLRLVNMQTTFEHRTTVPSEETVRQILDRERVWNAHIGSYVPKYEGRELDLDKTLEENGILDERDRYLEAGISPEVLVPAVSLYFKDDLTAAFPPGEEHRRLQGPVL